MNLKRFLKLTKTDLEKIKTYENFRRATNEGGENTFREYQLLNYLYRQACKPYLKQYIRTGEWQEYISMVALNEELMPLAFGELFELVPKELQRNFAIGCYQQHGDKYSEVRARVSELDRIGAKELPEELQNQEIITIYRAGEEEPEEAAERLSWTTNLDTANWFMDEYRSARAKYVFAAKIKVADIIAYTNDRSEYEVLQYGSAYDVKILRKKKIFNY